MPVLSILVLIIFLPGWLAALSIYKYEKIQPSSWTIIIWVTFGIPMVVLFSVRLVFEIMAYLVHTGG